MTTTALRRAARAVALSLLAGAALAACEEGGAEDRVPANQPAAPAPQTQPAPRSTTVGRPAGSTLGKAKQAAENVVDEAEQRQRDLEKQLEDPDG